MSQSLTESAIEMSNDRKMRPSELGTRVFWSLLCLPLTACVFDLAPLERLGNSGGGGGHAGAPPDASTGGQGGDGDECPGQKRCGDQCVDVSVACPDACAESCELPNARAECTQDGRCELVECNDGYVDCDGDPANGCEADFRFQALAEPDAPPAEAPALLVPELKLEGSLSWFQDDVWRNIPLVALSQPCIDCDPVDGETLPQPTLLRNQPPSSAEDLQAGFALAWYGPDLYLRVLLRDDERVESAPDGTPDPRGVDNLEFLFDSVRSSQGDDRHLFVDLSGRSYVRAGGTTSGDGTEFHVQTAGTCTQLTGRLTGQFLSRGDGEPLPLASGETYDFDLAVNDYDWSPNSLDGGLERQRQTHLFYRDPGNAYWYGSRVLPPLTLE